MKILHNHILTNDTGFKTPIIVKKFIQIEHIDDFAELSHVTFTSPLIIGGATNYLFVNSEIDEAISFIGTGITVLEDNPEHSIIRVEGGKSWHEFVMQMLDAQLFGLENLVLIPGTCGAAPVQNIGAYGREVSEFITSVHCYDIREKSLFSLTKEECNFSYRHSIFKTSAWKDIMITHVDFTLSKQANPMARYPDVEQYLKEKEITNPGPNDIAHAIIDIRTKKLPNPDITGNAGSFFKNPIISLMRYKVLQQSFPEMPSYPVNDDSVKIPAGWLIDKAGWKGYRHNGAGVHDRQALVLINADNANGRDIHDLSRKIQHSIYELYGIDLEPEVNIIL